MLHPAQLDQVRKEERRVPERRVRFEVPNFGQGYKHGTFQQCVGMRSGEHGEGAARAVNESVCWPG